MAYRDYIIHNFKWKVFSMVLAALTWFTISSRFEKGKASGQYPVVSTIPGSFPEVPVRLLTALDNADSFKIEPAKVTVEISGPEKQVKQLQLREVYAFADLTDPGGERVFRRAVQVRLPAEFKVLNVISPSVSVERITSK